MKKSGVITIVGLLAAILSLQHIQRKSAAPPPPSPPANFTPPASMGGKGSLATIPADFARAPICPGGTSLNDILSSHGKDWGYSAFGPGVLSMPENDALYGLLEKYFSCLSAAYGNVEICNYLPGVQSTLDKYYGTPHYRCLNPVTKVLFYAYAAGKFSSDLPCRKFFEGDNVTGAEVPPEFCREAAKGFAHVCDHPHAGNKKARCHEAFPSSRSDCKTPVCLESFNLYSALKDGKVTDCPGKYLTECGAFFAKSPSFCSSILEKAGEVYCQGLAAHEHERRKSLPVETLKKRETERTAAEQKKAEQKRIEESNRKIRKVLGRE
jgi:hypothetical protein